MERADVTRLGQEIDREVKTRFPAGVIRRVALLQHGDDPVLEPGELLVRVFIGADAGGPDAQRSGGPDAQRSGGPDAQRSGGPDDQRSADMTAESAPGDTQQALSEETERTPGVQDALDEEAGSIAGDARNALDEWARVHATGMKRLRRELSLRLPRARLLEFTVEDAGGPGAAPRITMADDPALTDEPLSKREVVDIAAGQLRASYVFPDRGEQAAAAIEARLAAGDYEGLDEESFAERLTSQLYEICGDKHLRVRPMPPRPARGERTEPARRASPPDPGPDRAERRRPDNYGIYSVERLDGNIGYLDLHGVAHPGDAGPAIAAAMQLVSETYALIIDLRQNGGGSPEGVVFWCSYLFPDARTHFNDIFNASDGETRQFWSLAYLPGPRYLDRPVYLLTSQRTFSGGEDFCYTLQAQGRAELIGETTGGGAHPTRTMPISATLAISVPFARSVNPVTGTNWEGTGVVPDVPVPAEQAFDVAYGKALRHVLSTDVPPPIEGEAREALQALPATAQA